MNLQIKEQLNGAAFIEKFTAVNSAMSVHKEVGFALQILSDSAYLQTATKNSIIQAVYNVALSGLSLNPILKLAYLVPRKVKENNTYVLKAVLEPSYKGLMKILTDAGSIKNIYAELVYATDNFKIEKGSNPSIFHQPDYFSKDRGEIVGVYAVGHLIKGGFQFEVMNIAEIKNIMQRSESVKSGSSFSPWKSDFGEMAKKTVVKRLTKMLPLTEISDSTLSALSLDFENDKLEFQNYSEKTIDAGYFEEKTPEQLGETTPTE